MVDNANDTEHSENCSPGDSNFSENFEFNDFDDSDESQLDEEAELDAVRAVSSESVISNKQEIDDTVVCEASGGQVIDDDESWET